MEKVEQVQRLSNIDAIASELVALAGNDPVIVRSMAEAAKYLRIGDPVQHLGNPSISGVVGKAVTESLCVAVTTDDNLSGASCFCDPRNLRIEATRANDEEIARLKSALGSAFETMIYVFETSDDPVTAKAAKASADEIDAAILGAPNG